MAQFIQSEQIIYTQGNEKIDIDRYDFETRSKETSVIVDFTKNKIYGDKIAFGEWYKIEFEECIELLKTLEIHEVIRDFNGLILQHTEEIITNN